MHILDGKVAIITGATSGIGACIGQLFVAEGARVVMEARRLPEGEAMQARLGEAASFVRAVVADESDMKAVIEHGRHVGNGRRAL
jgi:NADP-dependent 3-hydroxy acid dehydrogenase YdfG